jgi:membrane protein YqaA with SNARE-associated domain
VGIGVSTLLFSADLPAHPCALALVAGVMKMYTVPSVTNVLMHHTLNYVHYCIYFMRFDGDQ